MADEPQKSDIDFDELDKAVASLMGKVGSETIEDEEQKTKTLAINSTLKPDQAPKYDEIEKTAEKIGDETVVTTDNVALPDDISKLPDQMNLPAAETPVLNPVTRIADPVPERASTYAAEQVASKVASVPRPNSGRFMDMVHPKADMRAATPTPDLIVPSRAPAAARSVAAPSSVHDSAVSEAPEADRAPANPLADQSALATPFLPDAKVEKRPLGGTVSAIAPLSPTSEILSAAEEATATPDSELNESAVETLPINGENNRDAGNTDAQHELNPADYEKESSTEQALAQIEITEEKVPEPPKTIETVESGDTENLKSGNNKMTYQDAQKEIESGGSAIYDVKNYHQPLAHPKKQKSGWGVVLIVAVIIIVAAALGAAAYFILGLGT